ncbi:hypothetical protein BD310DRAFT_933301 [Dichomitus squalens]|uniref:Uncharacterized protein n=1 Tax=Dichomitus squalens TaxID=114155 RepID=A0A4Q9PN30_9APHY|nr:hypothetical protein BD310DRAFT_933301 [Dichomitus squalens]
MSRATHTASAPVSGSVARTGRSYDAYRVPRELAPGFMDNGIISANHPIVQQFVAFAARKLLAAEALDAATGRAAVADRHRSPKHPEVTLWRLEEGGVACVGDVEDALGAPVPARLAEAIFALAALAVYAFPMRPAHWAFWAENSQKRVSGLIHGVVCECSDCVWSTGSWLTEDGGMSGADPKVIHVPNGVSWDSADRAVKDLRFWHKGWREEDTQGPLERRRSPRKPKKSASGDIPPSSATKQQVKNTNGKRPAPDDGPSQSTKRRRKAKDDMAGTNEETGTPRRSRRTRKEVQEASSSTSSSSMALAVDDSAGMAVDMEAVQAVEDTEASTAAGSQNPPAAKSTRRPRGKAAATRRPAAKRKARNTRKAPSGGSPCESPSLSAQSPITIRIPPRSATSSPAVATRELADGAPALTWDEPTVAASPWSSCDTAVEPSTGVTTRVGTPQPDLEGKVKPGSLRPKVAPEVAGRLSTKMGRRALRNR